MILLRIFLSSLCFTLCISVTFLLIPINASALSEYGMVCEDNDDCADCKEDTQCVMCMNDCWNFYGSAETLGYEDIKDERLYCLKKQAKWCNAQCWDKDDVKDPEYVSTKPVCQDGPFPKDQWFGKKRP